MSQGRIQHLSVQWGLGEAVGSSGRVQQGETFTVRGHYLCECVGEGDDDEGQNLNSGRNKGGSSLCPAVQAVESKLRGETLKALKLAM